MAAANGIQAWPCRDDYTGSLHPVPPETCRREMFCSHCRDPDCVFGGTPEQRRRGRRRRYWAMPDLEEYLRVLRLQTPQTCGACAHLRRFSLCGRERFVCGLEAGGLSEVEVWRRGRSWETMRARDGPATWCEGRLWEAKCTDGVPTMHHPGQSGGK